MQPITIGTKASASVQVTEAQLAVTVGSGSLRVFATPMLAALMEKQRVPLLQNFWRMAKPPLEQRWIWHIPQLHQRA